MIVGEFGAARVALNRTEPDTFVFFGETFTMADEVGTMPLLEFAAAADAGTDASEMAGLAAMHALLRDCLVDEDWSRFRAVAKKNKADAPVLLEVCTRVYEVISGRPTELPTGSAGGQSSSSPSSSPSAARKAALGLVPVDMVDLTG